MERFKKYRDGEKDTERRNLNIIRKWSLSILKMIEIMKPGLSMRKKRFAISLRVVLCHGHSIEFCFGKLCVSIFIEGKVTRITPKLMPMAQKMALLI